MPHLVTRYHDFSYGHRVVGHEGKCQWLHGHNGRVHFTCKPTESLDKVGRVIDFGAIKNLLCEWIESHWDHRFLACYTDPFMQAIQDSLDTCDENHSFEMFGNSIVWVPFNPTAENMAEYLVNTIGPNVLDGTGVELVECTIEETRKCSATYFKEA